MSKNDDQVQGGLAGAMALFIRRPVLAFVFNALIIVAGLAAWTQVPVQELPNAHSSVLTVSTFYRGASVEMVDADITQEVEKIIAPISGVKKISSYSSFGRSRVTVELNAGSDLNVVASDIRDALSRASDRLPKDADRPRVIKSNSESEPVIEIGIISDTMSIAELTKLVQDQIIDKFMAVPGVADVRTSGESNKIVKISVNQDKLAAYGLQVSDVAHLLAKLHVDAPVGSLNGPSETLRVHAKSIISTPAAFANLSIKPNVHLADVADVQFAPAQVTAVARYNGAPVIGVDIIQQSGSNALEISKGVHRTIKALQPTLPKGVYIDVATDKAVFIGGALSEVKVALVAAVLVVFLVIFLFLWDIRATLIPLVSIPTALIGTIALIYLMGFSLNVLTLLALVLATGLVVDDAIVVLENIMRWRDQGVGPRAAAVLATREVFFAVVATTLTLAAVFVPISFLPGTVGSLFREFGFVLATSVLLSSLVALSLCPMMASRFLREARKKNYRQPKFFQNLGGRLQRFYKKTLYGALEYPWLVIVLSLCFIGACGFGFTKLKQELTPPEDRGEVLLYVMAPRGVSLDYFADQIHRIEQALQPLCDSGEIKRMFSLAGSSGNTGSISLGLAPWDIRKRSQKEIINDIYRRVASIVSVQMFALQENSLGDFSSGSGGGLSFAILGHNYDELNVAGQALISALSKDSRFERPRLSFDETAPQVFVNFNREKATQLDVDLEEVNSLIQTLLNGRVVGNIYVAGDTYDVKLVADQKPVNSPEALKNVLIKTRGDRYVPLSSFSTVEEKSTFPLLRREDKMRAVSLTTDLAPGVSLGEAYQAVVTIAAPLLPRGSYVLPLGAAATLKDSFHGVLLVFVFAILIILLILAAQFESFISGFIIMATLPLGLGCAVLSMLASGGSLNIYSQIGLVVLVGIMAKNGILIVEFADQLRDRGQSIRQAVEEAANIRLRPVSMTMICAVLSALPLIIAHGAGAEARIAMGWVIVGGLGLATFATLYVTPVAYLLLARFIKTRAGESLHLIQELEQARKER